MPNLKQREDKIKEKRSNTPRRQVIKEIASWMPMMLYKNNGMITPYSPNIKRVGKIISPKEFDEYREKMKEIPYNGNFIETIKKGFENIQLSGQKIVLQNENSDFNYIIGGAKNSYLSIVVVESENICYSYSTFSSNNAYNSILTESSQNIYQSRCVSKSSNIFYSSSIVNSNNIWLSANLIGCSNCLRCNGLTNQSYCVDNIHVGKENFEKELCITKEKNQTLLSYYINTILGIPGINIGENITGSFNRMCSNLQDCYMNNNLQNARNVILCNATEILENCMDCVSLGGLKSDNIYASMGVGHNCHNVYCSIECSPNCSNIYYSYLMDSCSYCLGCIGLKNKSFCIFNKQYTKEERFELANKIFQQMDSEGILGDFFPGWMNPFYFNDTAAYLIDDSFTREEVTAQGYLRRDEEIKVDIPAGAEIVKTTELEDFQRYNEKGERTINPEILKKVIVDEKGNYYKIVPMELEFLQKHGLPLPEIHWLERIKLGFKFK